MPLAQITEQTDSDLRIPGQFVHQMLYQVDDLNELRLALYVLWRLDRMEGAFHFLRLSDLEGDSQFTSSLRVGSKSVTQALKNALQKAVRRGVLLQAQVPNTAGPEAILCLNSPKGQALVAAIQRGEWKIPENAALSEVNPERPNIFQLYEANIGPLTPMIADALRDAEKTYHDNWLEDAFQIAVERNKRSWHYIEAILHRWQEGGRDDRKDQQNRRDTEETRRRYDEWED
jgi:DnaD/phage-associated family protein